MLSARVGLDMHLSALHIVLRTRSGPSTCLQDLPQKSEASILRSGPQMPLPASYGVVWLDLKLRLCGST